MPESSNLPELWFSPTSTPAELAELTLPPVTRLDICSSRPLVSTADTSSSL